CHSCLQNNRSRPAGKETRRLKHYCQKQGIVLFARKIPTPLPIMHTVRLSFSYNKILNGSCSKYQAIYQLLLLINCKQTILLLPHLRSFLLSKEWEICGYYF